MPNDNVQIPDDGGIPPEVKMDSNVPTVDNENLPGQAESFRIADFLESLDYPATKQQIIDEAEDSDDQPVLLDMLEQLPDITYNSSADVSQALGENADEFTGGI